MEQNFTIKNITKNSTNLEVDWSDGKKSKFPKNKDFKKMIKRENSVLKYFSNEITYD